jgi:acyl-CoA oxidase
MITMSRDDGFTAHMLPAERKRASFDSNLLSKIMGTDKRAQLVQKSRLIFQSRRDVFQKAEEMEPYLSYEKQFEQQILRTSEAVKLTLKNPKFMFAHMKGQVQMADMFETNGTAAIHFTMFLTFLKSNGSEAQKEAWLGPAMDAEIFGAYAQTELGHGSNIRGLETTATFCQETDEFEIHSPTLTSLKWWPTGMYACTHAIVFANLVLRGVEHGIHGFLVQLRDEHGKPMKGVEVGEIGPKIAAGHTNIGFARFTKIRVPRFNMFQKLFKVTRNGEFIAPPPKVGKIKNISMMVMRVYNVQWAMRDVSKAAVIACRYSAVRKQGFKNTKLRTSSQIQENVILDYRNQQYRVMRCMSFAYQLFWNTRYLSEYLNQVQSKINQGDMTAADELPELHATCSGLKAFATVMGHDNIEEVRKSMGGQGFLRSSGIAQIATTFMEPVTVEGEQIILSLQVGRFLIKSVRQVYNNIEPKGSVRYLLDDKMLPLPLNFNFRNVNGLIHLLKSRARNVAYRLEERFAKEEKKGKTFDECTNAVSIYSYKSAKCHSAYVMARNNNEALNEYVNDPACRKILALLLELQSLIQIYENLGDWIGILHESQSEQIFDAINECLEEIRPNIIALTDAFAYDDYQLNSTLGRYDGKVYEAIYKVAKRSPLNRNSQMVGWNHLKEVIDLDFLKTGIGQRCVASDDELSNDHVAQEIKQHAPSKM